MVFIPGDPVSTLQVFGLCAGWSAKEISSSGCGSFGNSPRSSGIPQKVKDADDGIKPKKLSFLQRLGRGLSAPWTTPNAFYNANYEGKNFVTTYLKDVFQEAGSAVTGKELRAEPKKTFKIFWVKEAWKIGKGKVDLVDVAGLAGDILTDPGTWFGGAIVKGGAKVVGMTGKVVKAVGEKVAQKPPLLPGLLLTRLRIL